MIYTGINIGPIISTFDMVRKPKEIWAASYLFSKLMSCIVETIKSTDGIDVFSPAVSIGTAEKIGVGLYPDRVYCKGEWDFSKKRIDIMDMFTDAIGIKKDYFKNAFNDYFNIMCARVEVTPDNEGNSETKAIRKLNHLLDCMELNTRAMSGTSLDAIWHFITKRKNLYNDAFKDNIFGNVSFTIKEKDKPEKTIEANGYGTLAEYASVQLSTINPETWGTCRDSSKLIDRNIPKEECLVSEDPFYTSLQKAFKDDIKSYHKYICVVQADGDNMGTTFSHNGLKDTETAEISSNLVEFGKNASGIIYEYGGLPIYAGGDDLLFIAPVIGKTKKSIKISEDKEKVVNKCIFDLLNDIDGYFEPVKECVVKKHLKTTDSNNQQIDISPSMSYGVSITYYKFPLYEALASARHLLFDVAKNKVDKDKKNAIAWCLQKNSGTSFSGYFSKTDVLAPFEKVIQCSSVADTIVSAVSHKIRENQTLLQLWLNNPSYRQRNLNFFKKYLDYDEKDLYKQSVLELLDKLYEVYQPLLERKDKAIETDAENGEIIITQADRARSIFNIEQKKAYLKQSNRDDLYKMIYSMIRTAKFINGEEVKDE